MRTVADPEWEPVIANESSVQGQSCADYGPQAVVAGHGLVWSNSLPWSDGVVRSNRWSEVTMRMAAPAFGPGATAGSRAPTESRAPSPESRAPSPESRAPSPDYDVPMSFCEHCEGQRFDRARVLRTLRQLHKELRATDRCAGEAVSAALHAIRTMDIPHLEIVDEADEVVH